MGGKRILVIDQDPEIADVIVELLSDLDVEICVTDDAIQAYQIMNEYPPDLVLIDFELAESDNFEVCRMLTYDHPNPHIPIIMLPDLDPFCIDGTNACHPLLSQPFLLDALFATVEGLLSAQTYSENELMTTLSRLVYGCMEPPYLQ